MGNICRSPVAEAMLRRQFPNKQIRSAGLTALVGESADATSIELAKLDGLDIRGHRGEQITSQMIQWADLVLVMSQQQRSLIGQTEPAALGKTMLLGHWINALETRLNGGRNIPDPYKKSREVFLVAHTLIQQSVMLWADKI